MDYGTLEHRLELFMGDTGGIDSWLTNGDAKQIILDRLIRVNADPLTHSQFNQLLAMSHQANMTKDCFSYYWCRVPDHPYDVKSIPDFHESFSGLSVISSIDQLRWGLYRMYVDSLLYFGSIRNGYRALRVAQEHDLRRFYQELRIDTEGLVSRGPALSLKPISRDDRYLIAEMACKSLDPAETGCSELEMVLRGAYVEHMQKGGGRVKVRDLLQSAYLTSPEDDERQMRLNLAADELMEQEVRSEDDLIEKYRALQSAFGSARAAALENTRLYLSIASDLDVYVATSMRTRAQFREMADRCESIFGNQILAPYNLRYFDPTMSAAVGHEDKGLLECLMVKCAKVLIYIAGAKDSYGKDCEAAMALSLGKPVIFLCEEESRRKIFSDIHPLSRLIEFKTGVAVGVMPVTTVDDASLLLYRILENRMEYVLDHPKPGYYRLKEKRTSAAVRLQTDDRLLRETFWNCYHQH